VSGWPLTLRGTGAVLLAVAAFVLAHEYAIVHLLYIGVLLLAVVGASMLALHLTRRSERVTHAFSPDVAAVGEDVRAHARVEVRSPLPTAQGTWADALPRGVVGDARGVFPAVASGMRQGTRTVDLTYTIRAQRRGIRSIGPLTVTSTDPFGFARRRHTVGAPVSLTITPAILDLGAMSELPGGAGGSMHAASEHLGQGADNLIPRHYASGDSMRRIHWRASAHRDELMVRQEEQETAPEAVVVLDRGTARWLPAARTPGEDDAFETAVTTALSVVARLVHEGYTVTAVDASGTALSDPVIGGDTVGIETLAIALATVRADGGADLGALTRVFAGTSTGPLVLVTGRIDAADVAAIAPLVHHCALPVLLATAADGDALARAEDAGWRAGDLRPGGDIAAAWHAATHREANRVGA
jgi:uncharacterized protein (DUF58 family)